METRSKTTHDSLSEAELQTIGKRMDVRREQLNEQAKSLQEEREAFEQEKAAWKESAEKGAVATEPRSPGDTDYTNIIAKLRQELDAMCKASTVLPPPGNSRMSDVHPTPTFVQSNYPPVNSASLREAIESVPAYNGSNIPLSRFIRACRRARDSVPSYWESDLTRSLINKLQGRAYEAVDDEPCSSVTQLIDLLTISFDSPKEIFEYRGELASAFIQPNEHILDFISRIKELRLAILDAERRSRGTLPDAVIAEVDYLTTRSFCKGLPPEYRSQMNQETYLRPSDAFTAAKLIANQAELDNQRYGTVVRSRNASSRAGFERRTEPPRNINRPLYLHPRDEGYARRNEPSRVTSRDPWPPRRNQSPPRGRHEATPGIRPADRTQRDSKWCRYCKTRGHEIEECRKREYNNSQRQGNYPGPSSRPESTRPGPNHAHPVKPIETAPEPPESASSA